MILGRLTVIGVVCIAAILAARMHPGIFARISAIPFTLIGIALSVFMSFRNSTCYARWWEGRQLWGQVIVACRGIARASAGLESQTRMRLLRSLCAFAGGLSARLRHQDEIAAIARWIPAEDIRGCRNPSDRVLRIAGEELIAAVEHGRLGDIRWSVLEGYLDQLSAAQAACERIASTPVPFAYSLLLHRTALVFCLLLPFALAGALGWWTLLPCFWWPIPSLARCLSHQLEDPFGGSPNALPLDVMRQNIEREMMDALSGPRPPTVPEAVDGR